MLTHLDGHGISRDLPLGCCIVTVVRSVLLASRPDTEDPVDILLGQQAGVAEAGIARFEVHPIEEKHEADHEDDRKQCEILGLDHNQYQSHGCSLYQITRFLVVPIG
jgi:hypothetical protein